jgi:hypothetical protein
MSRRAGAPAAAAHQIIIAAYRAAACGLRSPRRSSHARALAHTDTQAVRMRG